MSDPPPTLPPFNEQDRAAALDHLQALGLVHYLWGALVAIVALMTLAFLLVAGLLSDARSAAAMLPSRRVVLLGGGAGLVAVCALAAANIWTGWCLHHRKHRSVIAVVAAINCVIFPMGTVLGALTFMTMARPAVKAMYERAE